MDRGARATLAFRQTPQYQALVSAPAHTVVDRIRKGDEPTTVMVAMVNDRIADAAFHRRLVDAGIVDVLLMFLGRICDVSFSKLKQEIGGDVQDWLYWLAILIHLSQSEAVSVMVTPRIGPLVKAMSKREFFRDKREAWHGTVNCVELINNLMNSDRNKAVLAGYTQLLDFLVQSMFWTTYRPDIIKDIAAHEKRGSSQPGTLAKIHLVAIRSLYLLCQHSDPFTKDGKSRLERIGTTSVVCQRHDKKNQLPFATGLLELIKNRKQDDRDVLFSILFELIGAGCVDKRTILGLIELGSDVVRTSEHAAMTIGALYVSLLGEFKADDVRFAVAIKTGLFELCLGFLERFRGSDKLTMAMEKILAAACPVSFELESSKAIQARMSRILTAVNKARTKTNGKNRQLSLIHI